MAAADEDVHVVLEQTLLKVDEAFVYRIPPMKTSGGHRAEDWNLAKPLATCSLQVLRRDSSLDVNIMTDRPKPGGPPGATEPHPFAQCHINVDFTSPSHKMEHWVEAVVDSSRYFVLRISDERTGREAHIGVGFRERMDATNFKASLQDYENALRREKKAEAIHMHYEETHQNEDSAQGGGQADNGERDSQRMSPIPAVSKLSLKEGEKIHVNLKGTGAGRPRKGSHDRGTAAVGKGGLLLKKPPKSPETPQKPAAVISNFPSGNTVGEKLPLEGADAASLVTDAAVMESDVDDDEWGEFESST